MSSPEEKEEREQSQLEKKDRDHTIDIQVDCPPMVDRLLVMSSIFIEPFQSKTMHALPTPAPN